MMQTWRLEFDSQDQHKLLGLVVHSCFLCTVMQNQVDPWNLLASWLLKGKTSASIKRLCLSIQAHTNITTRHGGKHWILKFSKVAVWGWLVLGNPGWHSETVSNYKWKIIQEFPLHCVPTQSHKWLRPTPGISHCMLPSFQLPHTGFSGSHSHYLEHLFCFFNTWRYRHLPSTLLFI